MFVTAGAADLARSDAVALADGSAETKQVEPTPHPLSGSVSRMQSATPKGTGLVLSPEHRERLLDRLAGGATNAQVAHEFELTSRQVQGIRMGAARDIAKRRDRQVAEPADADQPGTVHAFAEEVVRYLRQQDDVIVPQNDGQYMVNGRFRLGLAELVSRANRMRHRQGEPAFSLANGHAYRAAPSGPAKRHPIFWAEPGSTTPDAKPSPV